MMLRRISDPGHLANNSTTALWVLYFAHVSCPTT